MYPNDVEAALLANSAYSGVVGRLNQSYEDAWTTITINGTDEDDTFTIVAGTYSDSFSVEMNGHQLGEFHAGKLEKTDTERPAGK